MNKNEELIKYNVIFSKKENMVFISHLDVMTLFRRAIRRAQLPFALSKGFSPRVKISIPQALKLGKESENEEMGIVLTSDINPESMKSSLNDQLPLGIRIISVLKK